MSNIEPEKNKRGRNDNSEETQPEKKKQRLGEENKRKCPHCSMNFAQSHNLNRHIKLKHTDNNSFSCDLCTKQFTRKLNLLKHKCTPKCTRCANEFRTKKELLKHVCNPSPSRKTTPEASDNESTSNAAHEDGANEEDESEDETDEGNITESAFRRLFLTREWRIRGRRDPLTLMYEYFPALKRHLAALLKNTAIKFYIIMDTTMVKEDQDGFKQRTTAYFNGETRLLLNHHDIQERLVSSAHRINESFDQFLRKGSGWRLESINHLQVYSAEYSPMRGRSYIETPKSIAKKHAVINIQNDDERCFEYCIVASQHFDKIDKNNSTRPQQYTRWMEDEDKRFNFDGCSMPMKLDDITKFEKNNNLAINVFHIYDDGHLITPLRITDKEVSLNEYVNLLLIEGEGHHHYCWIRDFDKLLAHGKDTKNFCFFCCLNLKSMRKLEKHIPHCRNYGGQRCVIGKETVEFNDFEKTLEQPVVIYADFETFNAKLDGCEPDPTTSWTNKKTLHQCSGYSYTVISPYFPSSVETYQGEDAAEVFLENILEEEKVISDWMEINKTDEANSLTHEQETEYQQQKKCYVCEEKFLKKELKTTNNNHHLEKIKDLLKGNKLNTNKIPSIKMVKKQKRVVSILLHPDKQGDVSEEEKLVKQEQLKHFNVYNEKLYSYLIKNNIHEPDEKDEIFEDEDDLTPEERDRIMKKGCKMRDHNVWNGDYKGAAHSGCIHATRMKRRQKIPVIFHNLAGYDAHIIFKNLPKVECDDPFVIAKSMEKFIGFSIGNLQFMDSLQHLSSSLDKLVTNLADKSKITGCKFCPRRGAPKSITRHEKIVHKKEFETEYIHTVKNSTLAELFPILYENFKIKWKELPEKAFEMLTRKGVYPYAYMDSLDKFKENQLPSKEAFFNDLTKKHISDEDFEFVHQLWETFNLKNLGELHDLYMETDTLLLADVFQNYRQVIMKNYGLDPTHFYTAPALSWSAGLKFTKAKLEIPEDIDMHIFLDRGLRGGISMVSNHIARANNKLMKEFYDPETQQSFIKFVDANNLYGWAMSQFLPTGNFKWVKKLKTDVPAITNGTVGEKTMKEWENDIMNLHDEANTGYVFEVDIDYPENLHLDPMHDNFPLAPESFKIEKSMVSSYQEELGDSLNVAYGSKKLCLTLKDKKRYVCHYRNLKFYLKHGMKLKKIHQILQFDQSAWLKPYIDLNTQLRQEADNKFEEGFAKLMNNSFFGKTCEDVRKHRQVEVVRDIEKANKLVASPMYKQHSTYDEEMVTIQLKKTVVRLNKPRYIGMIVLDISKLVMYQFHYEYLLPKYPQAKLLFTDTDSFCYWIPTETNIYEDICGNHDWFDFSNYPLNHPNFDDSNNLIPGKMKDEMGGRLILEFVGLRAKMYSILNYDGDNKKTAKGVISEVKNRQITHENFKTSLMAEKRFIHKGSKILQEKHQLYTADVNKVTLSPFNDKKWITRDGNMFHTLSFGNILIPNKNI